MLNLKTRGVINSRDFVWLNRMYKDWIIEKSKIHKTFEDDEDNLLLIKNPSTIMIDEPSSDQDKQKVHLNKTACNQWRKLYSRFNPQTRNAVEDDKEGKKITLEQISIAFFSAEVIKESTNFQEAWNFRGEFQ
jgi:hypothetical protein